MTAESCQRYYNEFAGHYRGLLSAETAPAVPRTSRSVTGEESSGALTFNGTGGFSFYARETFSTSSAPATAPSASHTLMLVSSLLPLAGETSTEDSFSVQRGEKEWGEHSERSTGSVVSTTESPVISTTAVLERSTTLTSTEMPAQAITVPPPRSCCDSKPPTALVRRTRKFNQQMRSLRDSLAKLKERELLLRSRLTYARGRVNWLLRLSGQLGSDLNNCLERLAEREKPKKKMNQTSLTESHKPEASKSVSVVLAGSLIAWMGLTLLGLASWCYSNVWGRRSVYRLIAN